VPRIGVLFAIACVALAACGRNGDGARPAASTAPQATTTAAGVLAQPVGFLAPATPTPSTTPVAGQRSGGNGNCPPLPLLECARPGDKLNLYRDLRMEGAVLIEAQFYKAPYQYVLDPTRVQEILRALDQDVRARALDHEGRHEEREGPIAVTVRWAPNADPFAESLNGYFAHLSIDLQRGTLSGGAADVEWEMPKDFGELLVRYLSDVEPTPEPSFTPTPTIVSPGAVFFEHPDGKLIWDGPDHVYTQGVAHCGSPELRLEFGIPAYLNVADTLGFWSVAAIPRQSAWHPTGYTHGAWQILQGEDATRAYLVSEENRQIAFEFVAYMCA